VDCGVDDRLRTDLPGNHQAGRIASTGFSPKVTWGVVKEVRTHAPDCTRRRENSFDEELAILEVSEVRIHSKHTTRLAANRRRWCS
jgi:hypothetical protein